MRVHDRACATDGAAVGQGYAALAEPVDAEELGRPRPPSHGLAAKSQPQPAPRGAPTRNQAGLCTNRPPRTNGTARRSPPRGSKKLLLSGGQTTTTATEWSLDLTRRWSRVSETSGGLVSRERRAPERLGEHHRRSVVGGAVVPQRGTPRRRTSRRGPHPRTIGSRSKSARASCVRAALTCLADCDPRSAEATSKSKHSAACSPQRREYRRASFPSDRRVIASTTAALSTTIVNCLAGAGPAQRRATRARIHRRARRGYARVRAPRWPPDTRPRAPAAKVSKR